MLRTFIKNTTGDVVSVRLSVSTRGMRPKLRSASMHIVQALGLRLSWRLQELLSQSVLKAVVATDTDQSSFKMAIRNSHPEAAYKNPQAVLKGEGHCEAHHMEAKVPSKSEEHVFVGAFSTSCMLNRVWSDKLTFPFIFLVSCWKKRWQHASL